ncbi:DUF2877 domain-containing protein [Paenibacillus sp. MSJ-6]|uniref:DUF2877 domain-containing protein n=1 Tax=Paenibacillus brevis TaxID=2841508 RepID=A0ABS6FVL3_9BACL|nr:DUF2877 domain-containing protein [Paenibacillus brevis]
MVHSIFTNGLNISFGDYLVFVGTEYGNGVPFGIHIESYLYDRLAAETFIGEVVEWNGLRKRLSFVNCNVHIHILLMQEFHCRLEPPPGTAPDLNGWAARLGEMAVRITKEPGLGLSLESILSWPAGTEGDSELERQLASLSQALKTPNLPLDTSLVKYFIGRGQGLTPSGDDFLVGIMAIEHLLGLADSGVSRTVRLLLQELTALTTQVSVNYYYSACPGDFSTVILDLLASLLEMPDFDLEECAEALLNVGSTSGVDTYFGLWFAILSYKNVIGF